MVAKRFGSFKQNYFKGFQSLVWVAFFVLSAPLFGNAAPSCQEVFPNLEKPHNAKRAEVLETFVQGSKTYTVADKLAQKIINLPTDQQSEWIQTIASAYRVVPKKSPNPMAGWHIGGRPLLDRVLHKVQASNIYFAAQVKDRPVREVLTDYLDAQGKLFESAYGAKEILTVAKALQDYLIKLREQTNQAPRAFYVGGSFVNGKAKLGTSDIDISLTDAGMAKFIPEMEANLNLAVQIFQPDFKMTVEANGQKPSFYGERNALVLRIDHDKIELLVFPTAQRVNDYTLKSAQPDVYLLD